MSSVVRRDSRRLDPAQVLPPRPASLGRPALPVVRFSLLPAYIRRPRCSRPGQNQSSLAAVWINSPIGLSRGTGRDVEAQPLQSIPAPDRHWHVPYFPETSARIGRERVERNRVATKQHGRPQRADQHPTPNATTTRNWLFLGGLEITTSGIAPVHREELSESERSVHL